MKVTFTYVPLSGTGAGTPLVLSLGTRNSPLTPVNFTHTGAVQASFPVRAEELTFYGRGGASTSESFIAQKEHASFWDAMVWSRVTLSAARGKNGILTYEGDRNGRIRLTNCVLVNATAAPGLVGIVSFIRFDFVGGSWQSG